MPSMSLAFMAFNHASSTATPPVSAAKAGRVARARQAAAERRTLLLIVDFLSGWNQVYARCGDSDALRGHSVAQGRDRRRKGRGSSTLRPAGRDPGIAGRRKLHEWHHGHAFAKRIGLA